MKAAWSLLLLPLFAFADEVPVASRPLMPLTTVKPAIPDSACQQRLNGWVDLEYAITPQGKVADLKVTGSEPREIFDGAAVAAVSQWTFPPSALPTKGRQRLAHGFADCRAEQLMRMRTTATDATPVDCAARATDARVHGDRYEAAEAAHRVIDQKGAMTYTAPDQGCVIKGRILGNRRNLTAYLEFRGFTLVSDPRETENEAFWVWTNTLAEVSAP